MIERNEFSSDPDATLVRPLFDEEATETARPVVPLAADVAGVPYATSKRRSWPWALVFVSAVVGSMLGIVGVSVYQKRRTASAPVSTQVEPPPAFPSPSPPLAELSPNVAAVESTEPLSEPPTEELNSTEDAEEIPETIPTQPTVRRDTRGSAKREEERQNRAASDDGDDAARTTRGRASENKDDEREQGATRPRRARDVEPNAPVDNRPNVEDDPGPRRIDRVRDIFTGGQPRLENRRRERLERRRERLPEDIP